MVVVVVVVVVHVVVVVVVVVVAAVAIAIAIAVAVTAVTLKFWNCFFKWWVLYVARGDLMKRLGIAAKVEDTAEEERVGSN